MFIDVPTTTPPTLQSKAPNPVATGKTVPMHVASHATAPKAKAPAHPADETVKRHEVVWLAGGTTLLLLLFWGFRPHGRR